MDGGHEGKQHKQKNLQMSGHLESKGQNQRIGIFPFLYGLKTPASFLPP